MLFGIRLFSMFEKYFFCSKIAHCVLKYVQHLLIIFIVIKICSTFINNVHSHLNINKCLYFIKIFIVYFKNIKLLLQKNSSCLTWHRLSVTACVLSECATA